MPPKVLSTLIHNLSRLTHYCQPYWTVFLVPGWVDEFPGHVCARHDSGDTGEEDAEHGEEVEGHRVVVLGAVEGEPEERSRSTG